MRPSVNTPGGFFIGVGGVVFSLVVAYAIYLIVRHPAPSDELRKQQIALGLASETPQTDSEERDAAKRQGEVDALLEAAATKYNGEVKPDLNNLEDLRGVVRFREAQKSVSGAEATLNASSGIQKDGKTISLLAAAKLATAEAIQKKKPAPSDVKVDLNPLPEPTPPSLPNLTGSGVHTVIFGPIQPPAPAAPAATPAAPAPAPGSPAPAPAAAPEAKPATPAPAPAAPAAPEPNRPPLLNGTEPTK